MNKKQNGFTLMEMLIVVAVIAILVAIAIPTFSSALEKSREATDLANVRAAYAEVMEAGIAEDTTSSLYDINSNNWVKRVDLKQKQDGWAISTPITIGGITSDENGDTNEERTWVGKPTVGKQCVVSYYDGKITITWSITVGCILSGTPITLDDASTKIIDDITIEDQLQTFNFYTGTIDGNYPMYVLKHEDKESFVITLALDNGTKLEMCDYQQFFDMDQRDYFEINTVNYQEALGKNIMTVDNGTVETARIVEVTADYKVCTCYEIFTEYNKNFIANGVITLEPDTWRQGACTINEDLTIDMDQYQADVAEYGLFTYDEFADIMTEEQFKKMKVADVKIAVGKGLISEEQVFDLYRECIPIYDEAINY